MEHYNIAGAFHQVVARQAQDTALIALQRDQHSQHESAWRRWSFAELGAQSKHFATALQQEGIRQGDRVMLMVRPSMEFVCLSFALFHLGAVVILIDPGMGYKNLLRCIASVRPDILIGIPQVIGFSHLFRRPFATLRKRLCVGGPAWLSWLPWPRLDGAAGSPAIDPPASPPIYQAAGSDLAAIIFTTGSTGPPKGVQYTHSIFHAQRALIRDFYGIGPGEIDQPGFPLFALFSTALGACAVIPDMDPTRPAQVNPQKFVHSILQYQASYSFGSPAIWNVVSRYCLEQGLVLPVRKVLMAGAPVPGELVDRVRRILPAEAQIFTPYGATESLPVASIEGREILDETWALHRVGKGVCVGRALPGMDIRIIQPVEEELTDWGQVEELPTGSAGEIVVRGPVVTAAYDGNEEASRLSKIRAAGSNAEERAGFWHRMGDIGYLDDKQRLWFCGRKAHRVHTAQGILDTIPCEALVNEHPLVRRSALVGISPQQCTQSGRNHQCKQKPVMILELEPGARADNKLISEVRDLMQPLPLTRQIACILVHPAFPVDIRHNAKIFREQLAAWADKKLQLPSG